MKTTYGKIDFAAIIATLEAEGVALARVNFPGRDSITLINYIENSEAYDAVCAIDEISKEQIRSGGAYNGIEWVFTDVREQHFPGSWQVLTHPDAFELVTAEIEKQRLVAEVTIDKFR